MAAGPYSDETLWTADITRLVIRAMEDVNLVFDTLSGDTHALNFLSAAVIQVLSDGEETFASAAPKVLETIGMEEGDCPKGLIKDTILQLDDAGLVMPAEGAV